MVNDNNDFMRAYSVNEVSKEIEIPPGTIRQWEKSLEGVLKIPRDEKGSRYYTRLKLLP